MCSKQADAIEFKNGKRFESLSDNLKAFVAQVATANDEASDSLKSLVSAVTDGRDDITNHVRLLITKSDENHKEILDKLEKMNLSKHQLAESQFIEARGMENRLMNRLSNSTAQLERGDESKKLRESFLFEGMFEREENVVDSEDAVFEESFYDLPESRPAKTEGSTPMAEYVRVSRYDKIVRERLQMFNQWLAGGHEVFWVTGLPGAGKSTMMKFFSQRNRTKVELQRWGGPEVHIIRYYAWDLGRNKMQKTLAGLLCSWMYQLLLQDDGGYTAFILDNFPEARNRREYRDWNEAAIQKLLKKLLSSFPDRHYCFFIDGLDELSSMSEVEKLMKFLGFIRNFENVKICVSSRPDEVFRIYLEGEPTIKVQELTYRSMAQYAEQNLDLDSTGWYLNNSTTTWSPDQRQTMIRLLLDKAEGVFLWLSVVIENIKHGKVLQDTWEESLSELKKLPRGMSQLYTNMWNRLGDDKVRLQQSAAEYINLLVHHAEIEPDFQSNGPLGVLGLIVAKKNMFSEPLASLDDVARVFGDRTWLSQTIREVPVRSLGFLKINNHSEWLYEEEQEPIMDGALYSLSEAFLYQEYSFVHRSAHEFFINTETGKMIREYDKTEPYGRYLRLARGQYIETCLAHIHRSIDSWYGAIFYYRRAFIWALKIAPDEAVSSIQKVHETIKSIHRLCSLHGTLNGGIALVEDGFKWLQKHDWSTKNQDSITSFRGIWAQSEDDSGISSSSIASVSHLTSIVTHMLSLEIEPSKRDLIAVNGIETQRHGMYRPSYYRFQSPLAHFVSHFFSTLHKITEQKSRTVREESRNILFFTYVKTLEAFLVYDETIIDLTERVACLLSIYESARPLIMQDISFAFQFEAASRSPGLFFVFDMSLAAWCQTILAPENWPQSLRPQLEQCQARLSAIKSIESADFTPYLPLVLDFQVSTMATNSKDEFKIAVLDREDALSLGAKVHATLKKDIEIDTSSFSASTFRKELGLTTFPTPRVSVDHVGLSHAISQHYGHIPKEDLDKYEVAPFPAERLAKQNEA